MSTVSTPHDTIIRPRRRPQKKTKQIRKIWGDTPIKSLPIPVYINDYNHNMGSVDLADQYRASYAETRRNHRTWMPLFKFLVQSTIVNATKIWVAKGHGTIKSSASSKFRKELAASLLRHTEPLKACTQQPVSWQEVHKTLSSEGQEKWQNVCYGTHVKLSSVDRACIICAGRGTPPPSKRLRPELQELTSSQTNSLRKRTPRTTYGCNRCNIYICNTAICWQQHMALNI